MLGPPPLHNDLKLLCFLWHPLHPACDGQVVSPSTPHPCPSHLKVPGKLKEQCNGFTGSDPQVHTLTGQELGQPGQLPVKDVADLGAGEDGEQQCPGLQGSTEQAVQAGRNHRSRGATQAIEPAENTF